MSSFRKRLTSLFPQFLMDRYRLLRMRQREKTTFAQREEMIGAWYRENVGKTIHWADPKTYTEKLNVSKLYGATELKARLTDKLAVRDWISEKIGAEYLVPLLGVYDSFREIDFAALPDCFVVKCNHDSGSTTVCADKSKWNDSYKRKLEKRYDRFFLKRNFAFNGFEMHYQNIPHKLMIEQYLGGSISDYKILCFDGVPRYVWVDFDRFSNHKRNVYDLDWNLQPFNQMHYGNYAGDVPKPANLDKMVELARVLSRGFDHVRVDFYDIDGKIYFGEMTFTNGSGMEEITPAEWDLRLGELWNLDASIRNKTSEGR